MWLTQAKFCDFVVYLPEETSVERFQPNFEYVREFLIPRALQFYFNKFVPMYLAKQKGFLKVGECEMPREIGVEYYKPDVTNFFANYGL